MIHIKPLRNAIRQTEMALSSYSPPQRLFDRMQNLLRLKKIAAA